MSERIVPFTDNYEDESNLEGYQFNFRCERCGNGYRSPYQPDVKEKGRGLLRAAGGLLGGRLDDLAGAADEMAWNRSTNSKAKDKALAAAVEAVRPHFKQCRGCGNWVCVDVCWNSEIGQCAECSPFVDDEIARARGEARSEQIRERLREADLTEDLDLGTTKKLRCPSCEAFVAGGKFCPECGETLDKGTFCAECGTAMAAGAKFCIECGHRA